MREWPRIVTNDQMPRDEIAVCEPAGWSLTANDGALVLTQYHRVLQRIKVPISAGSIAKDSASSLPEGQPVGGGVGNQIDRSDG